MTEQRIPKARLNQIARRKLLSLGVQTREPAENEDLLGELAVPAVSGVVNPFNHQPVERVQFAVEGHDHLRWISPRVLVRMDPLPFFDCDTLVAVFDLLADKLRQRAGATGQLDARLRRFGLPAQLDPDRGVLLVRLELDPAKTALLEGDHRGLFAARIEPRRPGVPALSLGDVPLNLDSFTHKVDLEMHIAQLAEQQLRAAAAQEERSSVQPGQPNPPPRAAVVTRDDRDAMFGTQLPVRGEVWVMNLLLERETDTEVRYVAVDAEGQPYGAPRVLPRQVFLQTFSCVLPGAYRLVVEVLSATSDSVTYARLDSRRQRLGDPSIVRLPAFLASFVPEAGAF